ncbi:hypothetical protein BpHYR1_002465 [Brachionus plicatilis]|uniref:Uncharacterized protein n=1 Tax=Brachionus plicatilis TaxID=10195 RepID=A0A3M7SAY0_BRAPC|nr:hypothetical protein BpHYR1_002465 [Brachionus plicatilis]
MQRIAYEFETFSCSFSPKLITAKNQFDHLFGLKCQAKDLFCYLHDFIIIWDKDIYHECPLYKITLEDFKYDKDSDILISESHLAVQASGIQIISNVSVLTTVKGIYLSGKINQDINNKVPQSSTVEEMKELLLADNDYRIFEDIKQKNEKLFNECLNFKSTLNLFSKNEEKYLTHFLKDGSSITFYTTFIKRTVCLQVSNLVHCNRVIQCIQLINQNYTIIKELNVTHNPLLLDGIDLLSLFQEIVNHEMSAGTWYSHSSDISNIKANVIETRMEIKNGLNMIFTKTFGIIAMQFLCQMFPILDIKFREK